MFKKILIANRGEIAVRVIRACREMGIKTVAVYSEIDRGALHVRLADEACLLGPPPSNESYLSGEKIIDVAKKRGAEAIHPGYGFLSENPKFAKDVANAGLTFIGPPGEVIELLGDKMAARKTMINSGVPVVPGSEGGIENQTQAMKYIGEIGLPVLIKAAAGGGGKGMRIVNSEDEVASAVRGASSEAQSAFGDGRIYIEKYLAKPRHIEIQILCDTHGNYYYFPERECSIQRRHQKVIEESPSPIVDETMRKKMGEAAVAAAKASGYVNAGTVEFLVDKDKNFYFLEVNTRLQVEHPITEMVTGLDLVKKQLIVASGGKLDLVQEEIKPRGSSIECRIYAEDPKSNFMPSVGKLELYREPGGPGVRVDSGVYEGFSIPIYYDPLISKLITWAEDRTSAIDRMLRALNEYRIVGCESTISFHKMVLKEEHFRKGDISTHYIQDVLGGATYEESSSPEDDFAAAVALTVNRMEEDGKVRAQAVAGKQKVNKWKMAFPPGMNRL
ncbi:MAG: acetyl-CoA carboxylase biotin carboxylase subunit [candidate division Zixibacteria bacterium]|nr:acetyl-CoA carboxylase biotin carboxylase subunit [candidate division Zixibacteria bacterium]